MLRIDRSSLIDQLSYDPLTGIFVRKKSFYSHLVGQKAGIRMKSGYIEIRLDGRRYAAHRLAWVYVNGSIDDREIDHINGQKDDNRICNLRLATHAENAQNRVKYPAKQVVTSSHMGASWVSCRRKWRSRIKMDGKVIHLGYFDTAEEAGAAYDAAKLKVHPFNPVRRSK